MSVRIPLIAAGLLFACSAFAADWPEFRGPKRDGICTETGLLQSWPKDGPSKVWTAKNLGLGYGGPIIAEGKIFGMGTREGKDGIWALKESDGAELWFTPFDDPRKTNQNNGPSGNPTYSGGKLYTVSSNGKLVCINAADGKKLWGIDYLADFGSRVPAWGFTDSPLIDGEKVICVPCSSKGAVAALNKDTGKEIWRTAIASGVGGGAGYSSPIKATIAGKAMYVVLLGDRAGVVGLDAESGKVLWQYTGKAAAGGVAQIPIPVIHKDTVWVSCGYGGGSALLQINKSGDKFTAKELRVFKADELKNHHGGMVQVGDYIYLGHGQNQGNPACVDIRNGEIKWGPEKNPAGGNGSAAALFADGRLYFRYQNGTLVLIEPSPEDFKVVSSFKIPEPSGKESWPHPVIANGRLYLRDQQKLHCFNIKADKN